MSALAHIPRPASFRHRFFSTPQGMDSMAGVVLLMVMFYMLTTQIKGNGVEAGPYLNLPSVFGTSACMPENHLIIISIDAQNRLSIATNDERAQMAMVRQVAHCYHVSFTAAQLKELRQLRYLNQNIEQLPIWLSASATGREQMATGISAAPGNDQLTEYVLAGLAASQAIFGRPAYIVLRIDKDVAAPRVKHLLRLLQNQGINRYNLLAERKEWPRKNLTAL